MLLNGVMNFEKHFPVITQGVPGSEKRSGVFSKCTTLPCIQMCFATLQVDSFHGVLDVNNLLEREISGSTSGGHSPLAGLCFVYLSAICADNFR